MTVYDSVSQFRCDRCTAKSVGGGLAKELYLTPDPYDPDTNTVAFIVRCYEGHISIAEFHSEKRSEA